MSAFPGKVRLLGVTRLRDLTDAHVLDLLREAVGFELLGDPDQPLLVCDFIQARNPDWVRRPFFAEFDDDAAWFDDLRPAFGKQRFYFENPGGDGQSLPLLDLTETLLE